MHKNNAPPQPAKQQDNEQVLKLKFEIINNNDIIIPPPQHEICSRGWKPDC